MDCVCEKLFFTDYLASNDKEYYCYSAIIKSLCNHLRKNPEDVVSMKKVIKLRHDMFGVAFCLDNGVPFENFDQELCLFRETMGKKLTPDIVLLDGEKVTVIDFAVTRDPGLTRISKGSKYCPFLKQSDDFYCVFFDMQVLNFDFPEGYTAGPRCFYFKELIEETVEYWKYFTSEETYDCEPLPLPDFDLCKRLQFKNCPTNFTYTDKIKKHCSSDDFVEEFYTLFEGMKENWRLYLVFDSANDKILGTKTFPSGCTTPYKVPNFNLTKREWLEMFKKRRNEIHKRILVSTIEVANFDNQLFESEDFPFSPGHKVVAFPSSPTSVQSPTDFSMQNTIAKLIDCGLKSYDGEGMLSSKLLSPEGVKAQSVEFLGEMRKKWSTCGSIRMRQVFMYPVPSPELLVESGKEVVEYSVPGIPVSKFLKALKSKRITFNKGAPNEVKEDFPKEYLEYRNLRIKRSTIKGNLSWEEKKMANKWMEEYSSLRSVTKSQRIEFWKQKGSLENNTEKLREFAKVSWELTRQSRNRRFQGKFARGRKNTIKLNKKELRSLQEELDSITDYNKQDNETVGNFWFDGREIGFSELEEKFNAFLDYLFSGGFNVNYDYINSYTYEESDFLEEQKRVAYNKYCILAEKIGEKCFMKIAEFISKFCYSLLCMSLYNIRSGTVCYDCLSYENAILFCTGQKSHMGCPDTKPFKFIIPVNDFVKEFVGYSSIRGEILMENGQTYYSSGWRFLKMEQVKFGIELPTRIQQVFMCTCLQYPAMPIDHETNKFRLLLMLNNRRKIEEFLHDIKYLTYNILGFLGCYKDLLEDKFGLPHDHLHRYIEEKFLMGIPSYIDSAVNSGLYEQKFSNNYLGVKLQHPLARSSEGMDVFDCWVYSSHCMCKAAFTQKTERHKNLKGIIDVHRKARQVISKEDTEEEIFLKTNKCCNSVFEHDLFFNSDTVTLCAATLKNYLLKNGFVQRLSKNWEEICNSDFTKYANSSGLRQFPLSNPKNWGKKGHQVLLEFLSSSARTAEKIGRFNSELDLAPECPKDFQRTKDFLNSTRYTVREVCKEVPLTIPQFSMADKKQWGGNREIYIMTHNLKNVQWCLEQMFACVCKTLPNELISVPSNKRMKIFYDTIKESTSSKRYYGVFDCRKWAPLSNLVKYRVFVNGLAGVLPPSFLETFNNFWDRYYKKKLFVKGSDLEFLDFEGNDVVEEFFTLEKQGDIEPQEGRTKRNKTSRGKIIDKRARKINPDSIYSIEMNYSFMMGIFNYLSSLLHSAVQMTYTNEIVPRLNEKLNCTMKVQLWAHSDDSGGVFDLYSFSEKKEDNDLFMRKYLAVYEVLQKSCNHMFSLKKCTVTYSYFEIISNIMVYGDIVPVTTKFVNSHQLNLTTQGPVSDIKSLSSQAIEMISNGASFESAYCKLLCLNNLYFRFLYNTKPMSFHRIIPIECGGVNDEHPGLQLMFSSSSQYCRLSRRDLNLLLSQYTELSILLGKENDSMVFPSPKFVFRYKNENRETSYSVFDNDPMGDVNSTDCLPVNNFIFYCSRMKKLNMKQALEYSMDDIRGIEIMESYVSPRNYPLCITSAGAICVKDFAKRIAPYFATCSQVKFSEDAKEVIDYSTMQSKGFFNLVDKYDSQIKNLTYFFCPVRVKPIEFHMSNLLITNNSVYRNQNVVRFVTDKRCCIMDSDFNTFHNLSLARLEEVEVKKAILLVESGKLVENFYMVGPCRLPNGVNSFNEFLQFCIETNESQRMPTIQIVYSMLTGRILESHLKKINANCVSKAYSRLAATNNNAQLIVEGEKGENWLISHCDEVTECKQSFIKMGMYTPEDIMMNSNWICYINGKQAKLDAAWWRGKTTAYCHVNGRLYVLKITNHTIEHILCSDRIQKLEVIKDDIDEMCGYSLSFKMKRGAKRPYDCCFGSQFAGGYTLDTRGNGIDYIQNIQPIRLELSMLRFLVDSGQMIICEGEQKFKCYFSTETPCRDCCQRMRVMVNGEILDLEYGLNSAPKLTCRRNPSEMLKKFETTHIYKEMYCKAKNNREQWNFEKLENHSYCQPNTLLGAIVTDEGVEGPQCINQRVMTIDFPKPPQWKRRKNIVDYSKIELSLNWKGKPMVSKKTFDFFRRRILDKGMDNTCRELVYVPVKRSPKYYGPFGEASINQSNSKIFPEFVEEMIKYWGNNRNGNDPANAWLKKVVLEMYHTMVAYILSVSTYGITTMELPHNPVLLLLLRQRRDCGERGSCKNEYYYDPDRTYLCFLQHLLNFHLWGGQRMTSSTIFKAFWKIARDKLEKYCSFVAGLEQPSTEMEVRNICHVYGYSLEIGGAPEDIYSIEDFYQSADGNEFSVELEESKLIYTPETLGTTVYNAYLSPNSLENVRGIICTGEELDLEIVSLWQHSYKVGVKGTPNSVEKILSSVKNKKVGPSGEIVDMYCMCEDMQRNFMLAIGFGESTEINYLQAAYLFSPPETRHIIGRNFAEKPDIFKLAFEMKAKRDLEETISELIGERAPEEIAVSKLGNELFAGLCSGKYGIGQKTISLEVQSELEKIEPQILPLSILGKLQLTKNSRRVYESALKGISAKESGASKLFFRMLLNECQTVLEPNNETNNTSNMLDRIFALIADRDQNDGLDDMLDLIGIDTVNDFSYES